jgi:hypothetical protein
MWPIDLTLHGDECRDYVCRVIAPVVADVQLILIII